MSASKGDPQLALANLVNGEQLPEDESAPAVKAPATKPSETAKETGFSASDQDENA